MIKVVVNGSKGRMGSESCKAIKLDKDLELVAETGKGDDLKSVIKEKSADVVVDFTLASVGFENARIILESGCRPVIGTSGFSKEQYEKLLEISKSRNIGGIIAPNFAIGAVLMMKYSREIAKYLPDVEIIELHHDKKEDFPSGTAIKTAEMLAETRTTSNNVVSTPDDSRGTNHAGIPIHSVRLPGFVAHQEVIFGAQGQTLSIRHDSINRESFMPGVVLCCKKVMELSSLVYGMENII